MTTDAIELGAGAGEFGRKYYAPCLETDIAMFEDLDFRTDAMSIACHSTTFSKVVDLQSL